MDFVVKHTQPATERSDCLMIGIFEGSKPSGAAERLDKLGKGALSTLLKSGDLHGKAGQALTLYHIPNIAAERVMLIGCGPATEFNERAYRNAIACAARAANDLGVKSATLYLTDLPVKGRNSAWKVRQAVEAAEDTLYRFDALKSKNGRKLLLKRITLAVSGQAEVAACGRAAEVGQAIAAGAALARDLGNLPGNICTPTYLARQARKLAVAHKSIKVDVLEKKDMERLGMGALLSVARGSREAPKLISMRYHGGKRGEKPVVLVGKGVTFDSGGISIKPGAAMDEMKFDMCGAASVFGALSACAKLKLPLNVVGVVPATENLPDGNASKPGDIVTSLSGQTIEVLNTDAEGRLILCDALTYSAKFKPEVVIDIATLTGACVIALGKHACGLLGNHEPLTHDLLKAGREAGDRAWEMPLWDEYQDQLKSNFADMANIGGREGGTITAACFLSRYTKDYHWAHLDIAGVAWKSGDQKGATGRPVPLLVQYLLDKCSSK
jgi:leucyl aminopeptidase